MLPVSNKPAAAAAIDLATAVVRRTMPSAILLNCMMRSVRAGLFTAANDLSWLTALNAACVALA
jgi:hypothetical protein